MRGIDGYLCPKIVPTRDKISDMAKSDPQQIKDRAIALLAEANKTLKATGCTMRIELKGESLCLRGVLPSRSPDRKEPYRQRLALGMKLSPIAITKAATFAQKISFDLESGRFDWKDYLSEDSQKTCGDVLQDFENTYRQTYKASTWRGSYKAYFDYLPKDEPFSKDALMTAYDGIDASCKRSKQMCAIAYRRLAKFAGIEIVFPEVKIKKSDINKRDIPNDKLIIETWETIKNPHWQYAYGLLATYGLRPHELNFLDFSEMPVLKVTDGDPTNPKISPKTFSRRIYPLLAEWVDLFGLMDSNKSLPKVKNFGQQTNSYFYFHKLPFAPYNLRHAYAIRGTVTMKISLPVMARMMGHAPQIHLETYNAWIKDSHVDSEMRSLLENKLI